MEEKKPSGKPAGKDNDVKKVDAEKDVKELSPEEQMAAYEKDLKENDWGHQPC